MQQETSKDYAEERVISPWSHYEAPGHVLSDHILTTSQKREVLKAMKLEDELLMTATAENMGGGRAPQLQDIEKALDILDGGED